MSNVDPESFTAANPFTQMAASSGYTGVSENYIPPAQLEKGYGRIEAGLFGDQPGKDRVAGLVGPDNRVYQYYDLNTRPAEILGGLDDISRTKLINTLYTRGWYGRSKPGGGFSDSDRAALKDLLFFSNTQGLTWDRVLNQVAKAPVINGGGEGRRVQVTNTQDLVEVANRTALATMGRKLSPDESKKFAQLYQQSQRADAAGSPEQAPSADVFFQNRITQQYGAETDAYKYMTAISNVSNLLENL
jgi:hypothetical protein